LERRESNSCRRTSARDRGPCSASNRTAEIVLLLFCRRSGMHQPVATSKPSRANASLASNETRDAPRRAKAPRTSSSCSSSQRTTSADART